MLGSWTVGNLVMKAPPGDGEAFWTETWRPNWLGRLLGMKEVEVERGVFGSCTVWRDIDTGRNIRGWEESWLCEQWHLARYQAGKLHNEPKGAMFLKDGVRRPGR